MSKKLVNRQRASLDSIFTPDYYKVQQVEAEMKQVQANLSQEYSKWVKRLVCDVVAHVAHAHRIAIWR